MTTHDEPKSEPLATTEPTTTEASTSSPKPETTDSKDKQRSPSSTRSASPASSVTSPTSTERDEGERDESPEPNNNTTSSAPPLPSEPLPGQSTSTTDPSAPPLPADPTPAGPQQQPQQPEDDGWEYHWNASTSSYWFYNRFTQVWQENNPRLQPGYVNPSPATTTTPTPIAVAPGQVISDPASLAGGYNPAIHGDYDPNAWYAQAARAAEEPPAPVIPGVNGEVVGGELATAGFFNRHTGAWQRPDQGPERHGDEQKSRRQLNNFFDVDAAANEHDGRSLKAERSGKKPSKAELKMFKEKRRARKEEKRRAWLRD
ncbi:hypothetical protein GE09DRAFT_697615 [Coniochaeta sp. 2T2.1]|nr:hypothetical protein GE09DRAFT_697615 [Coniochaeta sp. 2T2.1]